MRYLNKRFKKNIGDGITSNSELKQGYQHRSNLIMNDKVFKISLTSAIKYTEVKDVS
jgi:hypothetical protein